MIFVDRFVNVSNTFTTKFAFFFEYLLFLFCVGVDFFEGPVGDNGKHLGMAKFVYYEPDDENLYMDAIEEV